MRSRVAQRGAVGGRACRWLPARLGSVPVTVVVLLVALVATQPAAAQESPHDNSPDSAIQFNLGDPASGTWSGGHLPSMSPISPTRLTSYHRRLVASTATVPPVATSHEPRPDWIIVMSITGTTATPNVGLAGGTGGSHRIYLRYKEVANTNWNLTVFQADTRQSHTTVPIVMTGLTPNTNYMIQVSFDNSVWSPSKEKTFTTKSASATLPMVSSVWGDRITACSVRIRIEFPNLGRDSLLVYFRWKQDVTGATWSTIGNYPSAGRSANSQIGLSPSTAYVAEATMDHNFTSNIVRSAPFTTTPLPDLDRMAVDPIADTTATVRLGVDYYCIFLDGYLRYKVNESEDEWTTIPGSRTFNLTGLTPLTEYVVEASLDKNFDSGVLSKTFTTKAGDPTVDRIEIPDKDITQTGAKVIVHVDSPNGDKVHIRYSTDPNFQTGSTIRTDSKSVAASSAEFTLDNLTSGTTYYVEASYDSTYPLDKTETANFTTDPPTVTSVAASDVEQTTATITVTVDEPNVADIHIRYSTDRNFGQGSTIDPDSRTVDTGATSVDFPLNGLTSGTTYYAQASYDNSPYPASDTTNTADFRTKDPTVSAVSVTDITQTGATVTVTVDEPNDTPVRLHYKPGTGSWSTTDLNSAVFDPNADIYTFDLTGLASGTVYTVYASYGSTPPPSGTTLVDTQTATFTTLEPNITDVEVSDIDQTGATVTVTVDVPNSAPVQLHYRKVAESAWSGPMSATVDAAAKTATFALSRLASGTEYTVYASYGSTPPPSGATLVDTQTATFTTGPPSVKKVEVTDKTDTTAKLTVTIAEPNGETQTVSVRYQTLPSGNWITIQPDPTTDTGTAVVDLTSLTANTQYKAEATLSGDFNQGAKSTTFTTNGTGPGVSELVMSGETQTGATATITIANPGTAARTVYLQYRESGSGSWSDPPEEGTSTTATPGTAVISLAGLTSGTQYEVQASIDRTFAGGVQSTTFTTKPPSASEVTVLEESPRSAKVRVTVSEPNGKATLFLHYGTGGSWRRDFASNVSTEDVDFTLSVLEPDTSYTVGASFDSNFPQDATATVDFHTPHLNAPVVVVTAKTQTTAAVGITVSSPNDQEGVVYFRYQETPSGAWSSLRAAVLTGGSAPAILSGLTSGTEYRAVASLSRSFPSNATGSKIFTTEPPSVDKVEVTDKTDTTAEVIVTIAVPNGESQTVSLATTPTGPWIPTEPVTTSTSTALIDLTGLTPGTQYEVEATLADDTNQVTRSAIFTTTSNTPHVSGVEVADEDIEQTAATAMITIANVTAETDVYLRYQTTGSGSWSDPPLEGRSTTAVPGTASIEIAGLTSGTQHKVQASLDGTFVTGVQTATFTTRAPAVSSVIVSGETRSAATVTVGVSAPNGQPVFLQYRTGTGTWIERFKNVATGEVSVEFGLNGLASGTTYAVQASYDSGFPATDATKTATFATDRSTSTIRPGGGSPSRPSVPSLPPGSDPVSDPNNSPSFSEGSRTLRSVAENTPSGEKVGAPVPAGDDDNDPLSFSLVQSRDSWRFDVTAVNFDILTRYANVVAEASGQVARDFDVVDDLIANSVQILTQSRLDYETKNVYHVTISVLDGMDGNGAEDVRVDDQILVTILVTDLEEQGTVTLSAPTPRVDVELAAFLTDPDEGITDLSWVWERSENRSGWTTISGATSRSYTPTPDDEGFYLRVTASYTDRRGPSKTASAEPENPVAVGFDEEFTDVDDTNTHADAIAALASQGVFVDTECDDQLFCPHLPLTRWAMAVWILRVLVDYPPTVIGSSRFADIPDGTWWIRYVEHLHDRKITIGCTLDPLRYCPDKPVTRAQMASFLVRALDLPAAQPAGFADTDSTVHAANIDALHAAGITIGCDTEPLRYCPTETVTREQMATFLYRMAPWLDRHALVALYNATNGPNWKNQTNWATDNPINEWYGVQTDTGGGVTSLLLAGNGLHGPIPHALTNLNRLQNLELSANVLTGCLPTALQNIPTNDLTKLGLPHCN